MYRKPLLLMSLLLSACGTNNTTDVTKGAATDVTKGATTDVTKGATTDVTKGAATDVTKDAATDVTKDATNKPESSAPQPSENVDTTSTSESAPFVLTKERAEQLNAINESVVKSGKHVIVNAANKWLAPGFLLSGTIFNAAGKDKVLREIADGHNGVSNESMDGTPLLKTSEVFRTGAYKLAEKGTRYIIHALGPNFREAPYSTDFKRGYEDLRQTYKNVYAEMDRLNKDNGVSTIGIVPISAGVFAGNADKDELYSIMINETLNAMKKYPELQPELYLFAEDEYKSVGKLLPKLVSKFSSSTAESSSAVTSAAMLALLDAPVHVGQVGSLNFQGAATSFESLRVMGSVVEGVNEKLTHLTVGRMNQNSFFGCEFETSYRAQEFAHYAVKATGVVQLSDGLKLAGSAGYINENMAVNLSNNMLNFLNLDSKDYERHGLIGDMVAQYQSNISSTVSFTTHVGVRGLYMGEVFMSPFMQISCNIDGLGVNAVVSPLDIGLSFNHQQ